MLVMKSKMFYLRVFEIRCHFVNIIHRCIPLVICNDIINFYFYKIKIIGTFSLFACVAINFKNQFCIKLLISCHSFKATIYIPFMYRIYSVKIK